MPDGVNHPDLASMSDEALEALWTRLTDQARVQQEALDALQRVREEVRRARHGRLKRAV